MLAVLALAGTACSAVGWELPNYGFFGFVPRADGRALKPVTVIEVVRRIEGGDTTDLHEGEFRVDTARARGERMWIITRRTIDAQQRPVVDSAWLDGWSLRTLRTARHSADGITRLAYDRRAVQAEHVSPAGRVRRRKTLHEAEPYGAVALDVLIAAMPLREGAGGQLPVVSDFGGDLYWVTYEVLSQTTEARTLSGGISFRPVWLVELGIKGQKSRLWVDASDRTLLRREEVLSPTARMLVVRGAPVPSLQYFPVQPLTASTAGPRSHSIRQGRPLQVIPEPLPAASTPPSRAAAGGP